MKSSPLLSRFLLCVLVICSLNPFGKAASSDQVFYAKAAGETGAQRFYETYSLSDGTFVVAGASDDLTWVPSGVTTTELTNTASISSSGSGKVGFLAHFSADLSTVLRVVHFPAGKVAEVRRIRGTEVPGAATGDLFVSGMRTGQHYTNDGYYVAKLNNNFVSGAPTGLVWTYNCEAPPREAGGNTGTSNYKEFQPWDVTSDGRVFYGRGAENDFGWAAVQIIKADGSGLDILEGFPLHAVQNDSAGGEWYGNLNDYPNSLNNITRSSAVLKANRTGSLHSVTYSDHHQILPDGHGGFKKGSRPEDIYYKRPGASGRGYNGYAMTSKPTWDLGMISIDRRNNHIYFGGNVQTTHSDGIADFEAQVVAFDADGYLKWWSRMYTELNGNNGLYRSTDSGAGWAEGSGLSDPHVRAIAYAPSQSGTVYAGTIHGVGKSTNGGATWTMVNTGMTTKQVIALAVHPTNPDVVYAGCLSGIWKTTDGGSSWTDITGTIAFYPRLSGITEKSVTSVAIHPTSTNTVIVGTGGGGAYKSTNGGSAWTAVSGFGTVAINNNANGYVYDVDFKPGDPTTVFFSTFGDGIYKSINTGSSASKAANHPDDKIYELVISATNPLLMYAATEAQVKKSTDGGATWSGTTDMGNTGGNIKSIALSPTDNNTLLAGDMYSGLFYTTNAGTTWSRREGSSPNNLPTAPNTSSKVGRTTVYALEINPFDSSEVLLGSIGISNNSIPDQYMDSVVVDYSQPVESAEVVVIAREHGGDHTLFWKGNTIPASINPSNPGYSFNHQLGDSGNVHISWIGRFRASNGDCLNSTWLVEYPNSGAYGSSPFSNPLLDKWPNQNSGWPDSNTTRTDRRMPIVDSQGRLYVVATGRRTITTTNAYQKMAHPRYPGTVGSGTSTTQFQSDDLIGRGESIIPGVSTITFTSGTQDNKIGTIATYNSVIGEVTLSESTLTEAPTAGDGFNLWEGESSWNDFVRVYAADFTTVIYSSILTGDWDRSTQQGGDNVTLHGIVPVQDGVLVSGFHTGTAGVADGNNMPTRNVPTWGSATPTGETGVLAKLSFYETDSPGMISWTTSGVTVGEGEGTANLTLVRQVGSTGEVSVDVDSINGTATSGSDYTTVNTTVTWIDGDTQPKTVQVAISDDSVYNEGDEMFTVELSNTVGGAPISGTGVVTVTVEDNDVDNAPVITLDSPSASAVVLDSGNGLILETTVTDSGPSAPSLTWSKVSGPGTLTWDATNQEDTGVQFSQDGEYLLRLTADDGNNVSELDVKVWSGTPPGIAVSVSGLIVHLPFDETSGTLADDVQDADGESNDGTLTGGAGFDASGKRSGAVLLDGVDDMVTLENSTSINDGIFAKRTAGLWFKGSDVSTRQVLFEEGGNSRGFSIYVDQGQVYAGGWNSGENGWDSTYLSSAVNADTWHHVVLVLDSTDGGSALETNAFHLYVDGFLAASGSAAPINAHTGGIAIGGINNSANFHDQQVTSGYAFAGRVDDFVLYNRALSSGEIAGLAGTGRTGDGVDAGGPYSASELLPLSLNGTVTGSGSATWVRRSGAGTVNFTDAGQVDTTATFSSSGEQVLRLTVDNAEVQSYDQATVNVLPAGAGVLVTETDGGTALSEGSGDDTYTVVLTAAPSSSVTVTVNPDSELNVSPSPLTFTTGNWSTPQMVTVTAVDDSSVEGVHSGSLTHSASSSDGNYNGISIAGITASITDNDAYGTLALTSASANVNEDAGTLTFTVSRTGGNAGTVSVDYATGNDTATAGSDYTATTGTLTWTNGDSADKTFNVTITDDNDSENDETFTVTLSNAVSATLGAGVQAAITIIDNDFSPSNVPGLVGWYDAQAMSGADGTAVTTWADTTGGTNSVADNLTQVTGDLYLTGTQNAVAPTLQTVSLNGYNFRSVKFVPGTNGNGEYELLKAADLVASTDASRTIIAVYKGGLVTESRVIGFGSSQEDDINGDKLVWNLGCDDDGTSRFDGAMIGSYSAGLDRSQVVIRTAVMESKTSFDEYIDVLDGSFTDQQVLFNGTPSNPLADIRGHFYVGDLQEQSNSDGAMAAEFDVLEVLVFETTLTDAQRQNVQDWLKTKYTTDPNPSGLTEQQQYFVDSGLDANVVPSDDNDSDGMSNEDEFTAGTNPNSPSSVFKLTPSSAAGGMNVQIPTVSGKYYRVYRRASLTSGGWTVDTDYDGTGNPINFDVTLEGFYRIEVSATAFPLAP